MRRGGNASMSALFESFEPGWRDYGGPHWSDRARTAGHETPTPRRRPAVRAHHPEHNGLASTPLGGTGVPTGARVSSPRRTAEGPPHGADTSGTGPFSCSPCFPSPDGQQSKLWPAYAVMTDQYNRLQETTHRQRGKILQIIAIPLATTGIFKSSEDATKSRHEAAGSRTRHPADLDLRRDRTAATTTAADTRTSTPEVAFRPSSARTSPRSEADSHCDRGGPRSQPGALS
jgi:hypothetical protein